jgi:hypothetical protein
MLLLNEYLLFLFISLSTQFENFWIHPRKSGILSLKNASKNYSASSTPNVCDVNTMNIGPEIMVRVMR